MTALAVNLGGAAPIIVGGSGSNAANSDVVASIESFIGGSGGDNLAGSGAANTLNGGAGNDIFDGEAGADNLFGGLGNDTFNYNIGDGADAVDGGDDADTLNIVGGASGETLDVIWNGLSITNFEGGTVVNVEAVTADLNGGADTLSYAGSSSGVVVNLAGAATGFTAIADIENVTGTGKSDNLTGSAVANTLNGGGDVDNLNGGAGGDILIGGDGGDTIDTGVADDAAIDIVRFSTVGEYGDTVLNFDTVGAANDDEVEFGGALNTAFDDGNSDDNFLFVTGNGAAGTVAVTVGQANANAEALLLTGANGEGVLNALLGNAASVAAAFNAEFAITAANGEEALLVVNDTDSTNFALWQWIQAGGGEIDAAGTELTHIGTFQANATVGAANFDFV